MDFEIGMTSAQNWSYTPCAEVTLGSELAKLSAKEEYFAIPKVPDTGTGGHSEPWRPTHISCKGKIINANVSRDWTALKRILDLHIEAE